MYNDDRITITHFKAEQILLKVSKNFIFFLSQPRDHFLQLHQHYHVVSWDQWINPESNPP